MLIVIIATVYNVCMYMCMCVCVCVCVCVCTNEIVLAPFQIKLAD